MIKGELKMKMKCKLCNQTTDWDSSVGRLKFIVCNNCVAKIHQDMNMGFFKVTQLICKMGLMMEEREENK